MFRGHSTVTQSETQIHLLALLSAGARQETFHEKNQIQREMDEANDALSSAINVFASCA